MPLFGLRNLEALTVHSRSGMNSRKFLIRAALVLIALPIVLVLLLVGFFYSVFCFPNRTSAVAGTIISSGQKRDYLLYVPTSYDPDGRPL